MINKIEIFIKDKINFDIINKLKELSLPFLNKGYELSYCVKVNNKYDVCLGSYKVIDVIIPKNIGEYEKSIILKRNELIPKDWIHYTNYYDEFYNEIVKNFKNHIEYSFFVKKLKNNKRSSSIEKSILKEIKKIYVEPIKIIEN